MKKNAHPTRLFLFIIGFFGISIGVALRLFIVYSTQLRAISSDDAVVGLEASRMLQGHFQAFFWGQPYGGTLETALVAVISAIFGSSVSVLILVPVGLDLIATFLTWRIARYFLTEFEAIVASIIFFVAPASFVLMSTKEAGFYWVTMDIGLLIVLIGIRQVRFWPSISRANSDVEPASNIKPFSRRLSERFEWAFVGVLIGLGWWSSPDIMYFFAPVSLWVVLRYPKSLFKLPILLPGALLGALPWLWANLNDNFLSLKIPPSPVVHNSYLDHLYNFFNGDLPVALGLRVPYQDQWLFHGMKMGYFIVILPILVAGLIISFKRFSLLGLVVVSYPFIFAISPFSWYIGEGRYIFFLSPFLAMLIVITLGFFGEYIVTGIGIASMVLLSVIGLSIMDNPQLAPTINAVAVPASFKPLEKLLLANHIHHVFANYWIAYRLTFETNGRVVAAPTGTIRNSLYNHLVAKSADPAHVFLKGTPGASSFVAAMSRMGVPLLSYTKGAFIVYKPVVSSTKIKALEASSFE